MSAQRSNLTGLPSQDKPWLKYYKPDVNQKALNTPKDVSFYRFYKEHVFINPDFPILKYFNNTLTTKQFVDLIEIWARAFCAVGVTEDEMVPVYGTWSSEIAAIFFALNAIGAHPYYREFDEAFPISPTTLKPKTRYTDGFINYSPSGETISITFLPTDKDDLWEIKKTGSKS